MKSVAYKLGVKLAFMEKLAAWKGFKNLFGIGKRAPIPAPIPVTPAKVMRQHFLDAYDYRHLRLPTHWTNEAGVRFPAPPGKVVYETSGSDYDFPLMTDTVDAISRS